MRYYHQTVRKALHHFLLITDFKFDFCYLCGYHPAEVVGDANWKLVQRKNIFAACTSILKFL